MLEHGAPADSLPAGSASRAAASESPGQPPPANETGASANGAAAGVDAPATANLASAALANEPAALPNSIAVIPFSNLSPREEDGYFAAGIHEEILNQLVKLSRLNVIARTSVMQYEGTRKTIPEIARELNVEVALDPEFARAWAMKAGMHALLSQGVAGDLYVEQQEAWLSSALRAAELDPNLVDAQGLLAAARDVRREWIEAGSLFRATRGPQDASAAMFHGVHLMGVGYLERAKDAFSIVRRSDPLNQPGVAVVLPAARRRGFRV